MKYLLSRIAVLLFLVVPFILIHIRPTLEPFPAVILPGGGNTVSIASEYISRIEQSIVAIYADEKEFPISLHDLLSTMPSDFRQLVLSWDFGLNFNKARAKYLTFRFGVFSVSVNVYIAAEHSPEARKEGIQWLQSRIEELTSYRASEVRAIAIRRYNKYIPVQKGVPKRELKLIEERTVELR